MPIDGAGSGPPPVPPSETPPAAAQPPAPAPQPPEEGAASLAGEASASAWHAHTNDVSALLRLVGARIEGAISGAIEHVRATALRAEAQQLGLPPRPPGALSGSELIEATRGLSPADREERLVTEILAGNVPDLLRQLEPVTVSVPGADGRERTATFYAMPDYLAVGADDDFVRTPLSPLAAQRIADRLGMSLPTPRMVDAVYEQATVQLAPQPMPPGPQMMSNDYILRHQRTIEDQRAGQPNGALTAGHKKDVILTNRLVQKPGSVAIYGWHQPNGQPIQPRSTLHESTYADYSHGARLVAGVVLVDGEARPLAEVLQDPDLAALLSDEGPLQITRQPRT